MVASVSATAPWAEGDEREGGSGCRQRDARRPGRLLSLAHLLSREVGGRRAGWYDDKTFALSFRRGSGARGWLDVQPKGLGGGEGRRGDGVPRLGSRLLSGAGWSRGGVEKRERRAERDPHPPASPSPYSTTSSSSSSSSCSSVSEVRLYGRPASFV